MIEGSIPLSQEEIERLTQFLDVEAEPDHADIAFDFGRRFIEPAYIVSDLFKSEVVKHIVLNKEWQRIPHYLQLGHIAEIEKSGNAWI